MISHSRVRILAYAVFMVENFTAESNRGALMRRLRFIAILVAVAASPLITDTLAGEPGYSRKEVIYGRKYGTASTMDVFSPKKDANGGGVIFAVSGGWYSNH